MSNLMLLLTVVVAVCVALSTANGSSTPDASVTNIYDLWDSVSFREMDQTS